jgi:hypothetical protein
MKKRVVKEVELTNTKIKIRKLNFLQNLITSVSDISKHQHVAQSINIIGNFIMTPSLS